MIQILKRYFILFTFLLIVFDVDAQIIKNQPEYLPPVVNFEKDNNGFFFNKSDAFYLRYMWKSFVALNWPNKSGQRDNPDSKNLIPASRAPLVWETYPQPQEVFLLPKYWDDYPDWKNIPDLPVGMSVDQVKILCKGFNPNKHIVLYDINQPNTSIRVGPVAPLIDQNGRYVRYQVTMNRTYFDYVAKNKYYDAELQIASVQTSQNAQYQGASQKPIGAFNPLPFDQNNTPGMIETKAAWRILDEKSDDPSRYYTRPGYILNPDKTQCYLAPAGVGLVALHIHRITRLSHVASTFEQVDNVAILDSNTPENIHPSFNPGIKNITQENIWPPYGNRGFNGPLPTVITAKNTLAPRKQRQANNISRATEIPTNVREINHEFQNKYKDSVLKFYQMINVQHVRSECKMKLTNDFSQPMQWQPDTCPQPNGNRLINAALESYTQLVDPYTNRPYNYSCQGCHSHARPCGFEGELKNKLTFKPEFMVMSYLLSKAKFPNQLKSVDGYSCNNPATQPYH